MINETEIDLMMREARARREREAPRTRGQLHSHVASAIAMMLSNYWERRREVLGGEPFQTSVPVETPKTKMIRLFERDPEFYHAVNAAVSRMMVDFEDYERLRTD
jgi:malate synthase